MADPAAAAQVYRAPTGVLLRSWGSSSDVVLDERQAVTHQVSALAGECLRSVMSAPGRQLDLGELVAELGDLANAEQVIEACHGLLRLGLLVATTHNAQGAASNESIPC
jgi:hypothetical protein